MLINTYRADALKRRAHGAAWYGRDDDEDTRKTYNLWGRTRPRRLVDTEHGPLHHAATEDETVSPATDARRVSFQGESDRDFGGPRKGETFPQGPAGNLPNKSPTSDHLSPDDINTSSESTQESNESKEIEDETATSPEQDGMRRRKRDKVMPWRADGKAEREEKRAEKKKNQPDTSHLTVVQQLRNVFLSWINLMLVFVPVGIAMGNIESLKKGQPVVVFVINFLAIVPLAGILSFATEELAKFIGEVLGGLLNASFGNAVELIVSIVRILMDMRVDCSTWLPM